MDYVILNKDNCKFFVDGYIRCVEDLNSAGVQLSTRNEIVENIANQQNNTFVVVCIKDGEVVATAALIMEQKLRYKQKCCHIEDVAVRSDKRHLGYGKQIVQYCIDMAKSHNCYKVKLNCHPKLVAFYMNQGITEIQMHMSSTINTANKTVN